MKLGEKIKLVRKHRGLTQRELGERLHLDGNAANRIAQYESGFRTPKESRTKEIAKALNVREENFFTRAETPEDIIRTLIWYDWEHGCSGSVPIDTILLFERVVQPKEKTANEENHKVKVSGMDAAMAHRERKQLNFSTIVDFSLSKQGISFVTLTHETVITMLSQSFVVSDSNCAI